MLFSCSVLYRAAVSGCLFGQFQRDCLESSWVRPQQYILVAHKTTIELLWPRCVPLQSSVSTTIKTFQTVSEGAFSETRGDGCSNQSYSYSTTCIKDDRDGARAGAVTTLFKVIHTLHLYSLCCMCSTAAVAAPRIDLSSIRG